MASDGKQLYPTPKNNAENKIESDDTEEKSTELTEKAVVECQYLMSLISNPLNDELKKMISNHIQKLKNDGNTDYEFTGYEKDPSGYVTARYTGTIIFDMKKGIIAGELKEKQTMYKIDGQFDTDTNEISKLLTKPYGEYEHLNKDNKHLSGHWDLCVWIEGKIDFDKKMIICKNQRFEGYTEYLQWK